MVVPSRCAPSDVLVLALGLVLGSANGGGLDYEDENDDEDD